MAAVAYNESGDPVVLQTLDNQDQSSYHHSQEGQHDPKMSAAASTSNDNPGDSEKYNAPVGYSEETRSIEAEQSIGVTKIEALYIVFGKGWKLALLWM